jgi:hypothetical protein
MSRRPFFSSFLGFLLLLKCADTHVSAQGVYQPLPSYSTTSAANPPEALLPPVGPPAQLSTSPQFPASFSATQAAPPPVEMGLPPDAPPEAACPPADADKPVDKSGYKYSWGGQYRILPNSSNFGFQPLTISNDQQNQTFVNQRMRVWATVNPNDNVEGYIQMQVGGINWGNANVDFSKEFKGPNFAPNAPGTDTVGILLRRGWVAYKDEECGKFRVGFLDWHDSFGDTMASSDYDFNIGGIDWTKTFKEFNDLKMVAGFFLLSDLAFLTTEENRPGAHTALLYTYDVDQPIAHDSSIGASVYWLADQGDYSYSTFNPYRSSYDYWLGIRGKTKVMDVLPINAFAMVNHGDRTDLTGATIFKHTGYAGKFEMGPLDLVLGKLSTQALYSSGSSHPGVGDTSEFRTLAQSYRDNFGSQGYWSYMYLTSPNGPSDVNDLGVSLQNRGLGLFTLQTKFDFPICNKLTGTTAAGYLRSSDKNPVGNSSNMGTEVAQQFTYNFGGGLKLDTGVAFLFTGDFYRATPTSPTPENLFEIFARLQLEF